MHIHQAQNLRLLRARHIECSRAHCPLECRGQNAEQGRCIGIVHAVRGIAEFLKRIVFQRTGLVCCRLFPFGAKSSCQTFWLMRFMMSGEVPKMKKSIEHFSTCMISMVSFDAAVRVAILIILNFCSFRRRYEP